MTISVKREVRIIRKTLLPIGVWAALLAALTLLFYLFGPSEAAALADEDTPLTLHTDAGCRTMSMADYLPGAVAAEMPVSFGAEALKAQAVAARTYALAARRHTDADVCDDSGCCMAYFTEDELRARWGDAYESNMRVVRAAVSATDGEILVYDGRAIQAVFHASSVGQTENSGDLWSALPYLTSVPTPETVLTVPGLVTQEQFTPDELCAALSLSPEGPPETWLDASVPDAAGRVAQITIAGKTLSGAEIRSALGLRSTAFTAAYADGCFVFTCAGSGHGVGMSQYGAKLLADAGMTYKEILAHYYPGAELGPASAGAAFSTVSTSDRSATRTVSPG